MERRPSSASSTTQRQHKRVDSKIGLTPSPASLLVRNLRLLDLDTRPDWPVITPASFGNQDARTRMRCAEWTLYQLFRIYDPATTTDKLQPFFPPLEPLQSINLRAALYRCLNELKKDGVLGRETVLRKTMLDDCQGDKFFEVCLTFSAIVLRKAKVESQREDRRPVAQQIGSKQALGKRQRESMLPLAIAHKAALTKVLAQRDNKSQAYSNLGDLLVEKEVDLEHRKIRIAEQQRNTRDRSRNASFAQEVLEKHWVGSNELRAAILDGDAAAGGDGVLTQPFESLWKATEQNRLFTQCTADTGILEDLEKRTQQQKRRLQKWQNFHERLLTSRRPKKAALAPKDVPLRFDQHQSLTLRDLADEPPRPPPPSKKHKNVSAAKYDDILTAMREELRLKSANPQGSPTKATPQAKRPAANRQNLSQDSSTNPPGDFHQRSNSQTAVPVRPGIHKRFSSRSRSYNQPKVAGQRGPIPLKSESSIFSPLATKRLSSGSSGSPTSATVASPTDDSSPGARMVDILEATSRRIQQDNELTAAMEASLAGNTHSRSNSDNASPTFRKVSYDARDRDSGVELPMRPNPINTRNSARPNLADRTRMSMAFKSSDDFTSIIPETEPLSPGMSATPTPSEGRPGLERRSTLQERTRQSIISLPIAPQRKPTHARSRTSAFPVNQFETPERATRRSTVYFENPGTPSQRRDLTPREELFGQDAEYASVFKARPKIALSPVISPSAGGMDPSPLVALGEGEM